MKNFLLLLFIVTTLLGCEDRGQDCYPPPPVLNLLINKESENYKEFVDSAGNISKDNVKIYKEDKIYPFMLDNTYRKDYLIIRINLNFENDIYTGKTETFYLQNPVKTYKIEVNGYMQSEGCGPVAHTNEIRVDGIKIEGNYLAK